MTAWTGGFSEVRHFPGILRWLTCFYGTYLAHIRVVADCEEERVALWNRSSVLHFSMFSCELKIKFISRIWVHFIQWQWSGCFYIKLLKGYCHFQPFYHVIAMALTVTHRYSMRNVYPRLSAWKYICFLMAAGQASLCSCVCKLWGCRLHLIITSLRMCLHDSQVCNGPMSCIAIMIGVRCSLYVSSYRFRWEYTQTLRDITRKWWIILCYVRVTCVSFVRGMLLWA